MPTFWQACEEFKNEMRNGFLSQVKCGFSDKKSEEKNNVCIKFFAPKQMIFPMENVKSII